MGAPHRSDGGGRRPSGAVGSAVRRGVLRERGRVPGRAVAYGQNAVRNTATSSCDVVLAQRWLACGSRAIGEPSVHGAELSGRQVLSQLHMQSRGSVVAVRPSPKPIAPIVVLIARWPVTLSAIHATSSGRVSPQSSWL